MPQSHSCIYIHLVFSTKERRRFLKDHFREDLHSYMGGALKRRDCIPFSIGSVEDHVHLLFSLSRNCALKQVVSELKTSTGRMLKSQNTAPPEFGWQSGYGAFSVSKSKLSEVTSYIENQKQRHQKISFKEELISFLEKHGLEYDERYLWE